MTDRAVALLSRLKPDQHEDACKIIAEASRHPQGRKALLGVSMLITMTIISEDRKRKQKGNGHE